MTLSIQLFGQSIGVLTNYKNQIMTPAPYLLHINSEKLHFWGFATATPDLSFSAAYVGIGWSPNSNFNTNIGFGAVSIRPIKFGNPIISNLTIWNTPKFQIINFMELGIGRDYFWKRSQVNYALNSHWRVGLMSHWGHGAMLRWSSKKRENKAPQFVIEMGIYPLSDNFKLQSPNGSLRTEYNF
jgi:hypothetical protein